jgi:hypothetical protein
LKLAVTDVPGWNVGLPFVNGPSGRILYRIFSSFMAESLEALTVNVMPLGKPSVTPLSDTVGATAAEAGAAEMFVAAKTNMRRSRANGKKK